MLRPNSAICLAALVALLVSVLSIGELRAGESDAERDEQLPGLPFFGEVKEAGSLKSMEDVQVKAEMGVRRITVRTDADGRYKMHLNFGKDVAPDSITVSCAKEGYETIDVSRRRMSAAANAPVEVDCLLSPKK
jgi:hypothetical protein